LEVGKTVEKVRWKYEEMKRKRKGGMRAPDFKRSGV